MARDMKQAPSLYIYRPFLCMGPCEACDAMMKRGLPWRLWRGAIRHAYKD